MLNYTDKGDKSHYREESTDVKKNLLIYFLPISKKITCLKEY